MDVGAELDADAGLSLYFGQLVAPGGEIAIDEDEPEPVDGGARPGDGGSIDRGLVEQLVRGVFKNRAELDQMLAAASKNWRLERMALVDRNVIRLALFEIKYLPRRAGRGRHQRGHRAVQALRQRRGVGVRQRPARPRRRRARPAPVTMKISFLPVELARWDQAPPGDLLAVGFYQDVRPLRGAAGLLDWRFDGRLSALIVAGGLTGAVGEQLLMPSNRRLPWRLTLAVGLGASAELDEPRATQAIRRVLVTMRGLALVRLALALPGREGDRLAARRALQLFLEETEKTLPGVLDDITLVETPAGQKELGDAVRKRGAATRAREPRARGTAH